jgi:hypothetical protein
MPAQSFHGAGHAGVIGSYTDPDVAPAIYEVDSAQSGVLRETLRELAVERYALRFPSAAVPFAPFETS